ncbi:MAG: FAA hydrolase family protein, partial [Pelagibacteraceae bacterium]|nr:FAA hydrolase family protein [Pelagibacteraceae bacterium]
MKLLRYGNKGKEKPAALDKNGKIRDLSSYVTDFDTKNLNFETLTKLQKINLKSLPEIQEGTRIGSCINKPGKFVAIGLNYSDHAAETGAKIPSEPIIFMKATSCINGPNDDIELALNSKK